MKTLLFGNGINIQFGGSDNFNKSIILRAIQNTKNLDFPRHIIVDEPELIISLLGHLFLALRPILSHEYDEFAFTTDEKFALNNFIRRYEKWPSLSVLDIGFEDYYLIHNLFCYKNKIVNPDRYYIRESLKTFFSDLDYLFTTNYDTNVKTFSGKVVSYLHGAFHIKSRCI